MNRQDFCHLIDITEKNRQDIEIHTPSHTYLISRECFDSIRFLGNTLIAHTNHDIYISIEAVESVTAW